MTEEEARKLLEKAAYKIYENKYQDQITGEPKTNYYVFAGRNRLPAATLAEIVISLGFDTRMPDRIENSRLIDKAITQFNRKNKMPVSPEKSLVMTYDDQTFVILKNKSGETVAQYSGTDLLSKIDRLPWEPKR